jgi:hypothetical protein
MGFMQQSKTTHTSAQKPCMVMMIQQQLPAAMEARQQVLQVTMKYGCMSHDGSYAARWNHTHTHISTTTAVDGDSAAAPSCHGSATAGPAGTTQQQHTSTQLATEPQEPQVLQAESCSSKVGQYTSGQELVMIMVIQPHLPAAIVSRQQVLQECSSSTRQHSSSGT